MSKLMHAASTALLVSAFIALFASTKTPVQIEIGRLINVYTPSSPPYVGAFSLLLSFPSSWRVIPASRGERTFISLNPSFPKW